LRGIKAQNGCGTSAQRLVDLYRRRVELGFNSPIDIRQAEVAVSIDREQLLLATNVFLERQFALKRLILDRYKAETPRIFVPVDTPQLPYPAAGRFEWLRIAF